MKKIIILSLLFIFIGFPCFGQTAAVSKNQQIVDAIIKYGPSISPTYEKAVCTELLIKILEKFTPLDKTDKSRIRIITDENIPELLQRDSQIPKGVFYALTSNGKGTAINNPDEVKAGDLVQLWTDTWGHCGVVKSINPAAKTMELYSSFPSTGGYGIQTFRITKYCYFVRLK